MGLIIGVDNGSGGGGLDMPTGATLMQTGQTVSYRTGDNPTVGRVTDFLTLGSNNPFGNTNRFTDELGGGTYANNIIIDWSTYDGSTVLGWHNQYYVDGNWNDSIDASILKTVGTFISGWRMPNINELSSIVNRGVTSSTVLNYPPFNITSSVNMYVSTTNWYNTANSLYMTMSEGSVNSFSKTATFGGRYMICRIFTVTGTTLS
jgi:hypothetical protein